MTKLRLVLSFPDFTDISIVQESSRRPAFTLNICADVKRISEYNVGAFEDLDMFWNALVGSKIWEGHVLEPTNAFILIICANFKKDLKDYVGTLEDLEKGHVLERTNAFILMICANVKKDLKDYVEVLKDVDKVNVLQPNNAYTLVIRGKCQKNLEGLCWSLGKPWQGACF